MILSYADFLKIRRDLISVSPKYISPIVASSQLSNGSYKLMMYPMGGYTIECDVNSQDDIDDFEANRKAYCNKIHIPDVVEKVTHDFSLKTKWIYGEKNSLYAIIPDAGKVLRVKRFMVRLDKDASISESVDMVLWQTVDGTPCPEFGKSTQVASSTSTTVFTVDDASDFVADDHIEVALSGGSEFAIIESISGSQITLTTATALTATPAVDDNVTLRSPTPFGGSPSYIPDTQDGWLKYYPTSNDPQEVSVWLWMDGTTNAPKYKATIFDYPSVEEIRLKSNDKIVGNTCVAEYNYSSFDISMSLCSSKNERIEMWLSDHIEVTNVNSVRCVCSVMLDSVDEW